MATAVFRNVGKENLLRVRRQEPFNPLGPLDYDHPIHLVEIGGKSEREKIGDPVEAVEVEVVEGICSFIAVEVGEGGAVNEVLALQASGKAPHKGGLASSQRAKEGEEIATLGLEADLLS